jgi:hypothetical protein
MVEKKGNGNSTTEEPKDRDYEKVRFIPELVSLFKGGKRAFC